MHFIHLYLYGEVYNMYVLNCLVNCCEDYHALVPSQEQ